MNDDPDLTDLQLRFLESLVEQQAHVAGDIFPLSTQAWAIHGTILVDGEVLMAAFPHAEDAQAALARLRPELPR
ncbi:MAG TPA: hypothetical protein VF183_13175 [Acidimicrobiales bacterium]